MGRITDPRQMTRSSIPAFGTEMRRLSLVWKISLSTAAALLVLLLVAGRIVQDQTQAALARNLDAQLEGSFKAYESLWSARTERLRSVSIVLSTMSDVRAA